MTIQKGRPQTLKATDKATDKKEETLSRFLIKTVTGTFGIKVMNMALVYGNSLLLVRLIGASGYGEYAYVVAWLQILLIPAVLGFEGLMSRELAVFTVKEQWPEAKGLLSFANAVVLFNALAMAAAILGGLWLFNQSDNTQPLINFSIGLATLPFIALSRLRESSLRAIKKVVVGQLPETIIRPLIIFSCLAAIFLLSPQRLSASGAIGINLVASVVAFIIGAVLLTRALSQNIQRAQPTYNRRFWLKTAMPMLLIGSMYVINGQTDSVMLGLLKNSEAVGIYTVANRGASLVGFASIAFAAPLSPVFASLYAQGNMPKLRQAFKKCCQLAFAISVVLGGALMLLSDQFLLLFGAEFLVSKLSLFILIGAQLINAFSGPTPTLLNMTGYARDTVIGVSASAVLNIILNAALIPPFGIEGAAIATSISIVVWNIILIGFAGKRFGFFATALPVGGRSTGNRSSGPKS